MATLSITIADALALRARTALGNGTPVTAQQAQDWIKARLKEYTIGWETTQNAIADNAAKSAEVW